jgi:hypothetical protein
MVRLTCQEPLMPMKRIVLTFGLLSGVVSSVMMLATVPFLDRIGFDHGVVVGYTAIVLSLLFVFFGVRRYRELAGGRITFGRGLAVGLLITLISCTFYVVTWQFVYFKLTPDFMDKYTAYTIENLKASGASTETIAEKRRQMEAFARMYQNPLINAAMTFVEPFPVGLLISVMSAAILRRK